MYHIVRQLIPTLMLIVALGFALPTQGASFVYRGSLNDRGAPAQGEYAFRLSFYAAEFGTEALVPAITLDAVPVTYGVFNAELELAPALQARDTLWLQVEVRDAGGTFVPLDGRSAVEPSAVVGGVCWDTTGNSGTNPSTNFIGHTDNQPVVLRSNNLIVGTLGPIDLINGFAADVVLGSPLNSVDAGIFGATICGGGSSRLDCGPGGNTSCANEVDNLFGTVSGGYGNHAGFHGAVGGGRSNVASGESSTIPGGELNQAGGRSSFAAGYRAKVRNAAQAGNSSGDDGSFVWADMSGAGDFVSTGNNQFMIRADGGVGINTAPDNAALTVADMFNALPLVRIYNTSGDDVDGGALRITENGAAFSGGFIKYNSAGNTLTIGTNIGSVDASSDVAKIVIPRNGVGVGIGRAPVTNALEVEGNASKTTATAWLANSDARIKRDVAPVDGALDTLMRLRPVSFRYTDAYRAAHPGIVDQRYYNVIAQEFAEVFPDAVRRSGEFLPGAKAAPENAILQVDVHPALITAIAATQELAMKDEAQAEHLEAENVRLRADNARMQRQLQRLAQRLDAIEVEMQGRSPQRPR